MKKYIFVLSFVLFTMIFVGLACEAGGKSAGDDPCDVPKGDRPDWCEASDSNVGDVTLIPNDVKDSTSNDTTNVDTKDPLAEYMWLGGNWKCIKETKISTGESGNCICPSCIEEVYVEKWDNENQGARVKGFDYSPALFKKNSTSGRFDMFFLGDLSKIGEADPATLIVEYELTTDVEYIMTYQKQ